MKQKKITQLMLTQGFGGAERHFVDLSHALADRGYLIQAICHPQFTQRQFLAKHDNIKVVPVNARGCWDLWNIRRIRTAITRFSPEVVHAHLARGSCLGGKVANALGIPCVTNLHNYIKLKYYRHIIHFIAATEDQKNYLQAHNIAPNVVTVMPHFSLLAATPPQPLSEDHPIRFITLGRLVKKKGFDVLINAFNNYLAGGHDGRLIIGGDGPERESLQKLISQFGLEQKIKLVGWIDDVAGFLAQGDVFVLPSRNEPFGIVILEAMASGKPIISTKTKGPSAILDNQMAFLTEIDDVASMTKAMQEIAQNKAGALEKALAASTRYQLTYCADSIVPLVEQIYHHLTQVKE